MSDRNDPLRLASLELTNGVRLVRQAAPAGAASAAATYVGPAGWGYDPPRGEGTARLTSQLVTSAAGRLGRAALARRLDRAGATLTARCAPESAEVTIWGPAEELGTLIEILSLVVLEPRFDPEDVQRATRQLAERQLRESTQPANLAERELLRRAFPSGHPYRGTGVGTAASLRQINRETLVRFHREHYTRDGAVLAVTAHASEAEVGGLVRRRFASFPTARAPAAPRIPSGAAASSERRIDLPGRSQVEVRLGGPSIARSDPAFPAAYLANEVLGGRPLLSRLFQRVREHGGLAYHASSDLEAMRWGGYWLVQAGTGGDRWKRVVSMLRAEVRRLRENGVRSGELDLVRESAIGEMVLSLESTADAHELAVDAAYHQLPDDHWLRWPAALRAVRPADVRLASQAALGAAGAVTVVAGPIGHAP